MMLGGGGEYNPYGIGVPVALLMASATLFSFVYLQSGAKPVVSDVGLKVGVGSSGSVYINKASRALEEFERQSIDFSAKLDAFNKRLEDAEVAKGLTDHDRERVVKGAIEAASADAIKEVFAVEAGRLEAQLSDSLGLDRLAATSKSSVSRLMREISDLRLRSNINLLIGMLITAGGLWLLWSTVSMVDASELLRVLASEGKESDSKFFKNLVLPIIPRVLLVVFVEVFAYFFLRLYRDGLSEIKYFQNELTNVESKLTAIEFAYITKSNGALKAAIEALSNTERNFVLGKGQTTVELERAKSESELSRVLVKAIPKIFQDRKK